MKRLFPVLVLLALTGIVGAFVHTEPYGVFFPVSTTRPDYLIMTTDPIFLTDITRITDDTNQPINWADPGAAAGVWALKARHHYSKDQPWNSDGTILAMDGYEPGNPSHYYLDGNTYAPLWPKCSGHSLSDDRWSPDPNFPHIRVNARGTTLEWYDVVACAQTRSWSLPLTAHGIGASEGNLSRNGRYIALNDDTRMLVVDMNPYDPNASVVGPAADISACGLIDPNGNTNCVPHWISVSPSGSYVVVSVADFLRVYDVGPNLALTPHVYDSATNECYWHDTAHTNPTGSDPRTGSIFGLGHADMTLNPFDGNGDVIIGQRRSWCPNPPSGSGAEYGKVQMVRLSDGKVTALTSPRSGEPGEASSHHISTRNLDRPGWAYVGYYPVLALNGLGSEPDPNEWRRYQDEIVAIKLDGSGEMEHFAHMHSLTSGCYRCEEHAVPSRDGIRVLWASNWLLDCLSCDPNDAGQKADVKAYIVDTKALRAVPGGGGLHRPILNKEAGVDPSALDSPARRNGRELERRGHDHKRVQ
jgi:hypothetical protein